MLSNGSSGPQIPFTASLPQLGGDDSDSEGRATPPLTGNVMALRTQWEQEALKRR